MTKNLPAPNYLPFISFFEMQVTEAQKKIEALRTLEPIYNTAKLALERHKIKLETKLVHYDNQIAIRVNLGNHHYNHFTPMLITISEELARLRLRKAKPPSFAKGIWEVVYEWRITIPPLRTLKLILSIPFDGNQYCKITNTETMWPYRTYHATWYDEPIRAESAVLKKPKGALRF